jgi:hypothetical protein
VTIFLSAEHRADFAANEGKGIALATRLDIVELGASHDHMFAKEIEALGRALQNRINLDQDSSGLDSGRVQARYHP